MAKETDIVKYWADLLEAEGGSEVVEYEPYNDSKGTIIIDADDYTEIKKDWLDDFESKFLVLDLKIRFKKGYGFCLDCLFKHDVELEGDEE